MSQWQQTCRDWPPAGTTSPTGKPTKKEKKRGKKGCLLFAEYASTAAAKASGDTWCDGAEITITGGPVLIYYEALAVDGDVGLIHKEPYGSGNGTIDAIAVLGSAPAATDLDTVPGWNNSSNGVQDLDYESNVDNGYTHLANLFNGGQYLGYARYNPVPTASGDVFDGALIIDDVHATQSGGTTDPVNTLYVQNVVNTADGLQSVRAQLQNKRTPDSTDWFVFDGDTSFIPTGVSRLTPKRAYIYLKEGRCTVWFEDGATPVVNTTPTTKIAGTIAFGQMRVGFGDVTYGLADLYFGAFTFAKMSF